ncbi:PPE family protein [Mycobacterium florentinum]|uniref:PPE family protein n=1 Tax=Mycobacterium florentinum TaxID=292462 RepID=UPI000A163249|nr:PPE family protein [Mycobacterium florentinum]MCV7409014.1 PPE family protein [Mycobacterium florentinum]BBX77809.1 PPE family protein [Mycobacterium florentinum]
MDFAALPPEINSGLMYSGPGSRSMMDAATAWDGLATRLYGAAAQCSSATANLAAAPAHADWLNGVAAQAAQTATQATKAASAYELALAATVAPAAIQANRMLRTWLAETNCLGQSSPAIADAESDYDHMWAQDVDTMHTYARASADAAAVTPFVSPPPAGVNSGQGGWGLRVAPQVISAGRQVISAIPHALDALYAAPPTAFDEFLSPVTPALSKLGSLCAPSDFAINHLNSLNKAAALRQAAMLLSRLPNRGRSATSGVGRAASIGTLSVPQAWIAKTPRPATPDRGRGYEPMHLVGTGERPKWPQTR